MAETTNGAVLSAGLETENTESLGDDHLLHLVIGRGDTLEDLQSLHRRGSTGGLVGDHASDGLVEDAGGGSEVEGTWRASCVSDRVHMTRGLFTLRVTSRS